MVSNAHRILIVDDEPDTCANLSDILTDLGYHVDTAPDGFAALELIKKHAYDVALLDLRMPGMDGLELYRRIREVSASTIAIVVTAYAGGDTAKSVRDAGAWQIVPKPVNTGHLLGLVAQALDTPLVLVIDDDRDLCENLWDLLRERGYRVHLAHDGPDAEQALRQRTFHVVLIDMKLPGGDGHLVLRALQQIDKEARAVLITGFAAEMETKVQAALQAGANAVCYKPFDVEKLLSTVEKLSTSAARIRSNTAHAMETVPGLSTDVPPLIIVVDDDKDTRLNLRDILELDGYQVEIAGSARELFARQRWENVALVLLDRKLPDGTPQEILPRVRQRASHVAVIIVTGYADIEGAIAALRSGAADYILKPVSADALRASVRRVLERQLAEREIARLNRVLARSEARYRSLFENTLDGLLIIDDEGKIVAANPAACIQVGFTVGALEGKQAESLTIATSEKERAAALSDFFGPGKNTGECTLMRDDGTAVEVEYRAVASFAPGLNLLSLRDITARKRAEERARQAGRLAAIGETMAGLVHESRNALQRSKASLEMLSLEVEDRPEALKLVARAQRAQDDLHRLYEEVRQWAAPLQLKRETCSLRDIWMEVWCLVNQARPTYRGQLEEEIVGDANCHVDRFALSQVFRNIFENAVDASPAGAPVKVRCRTESNGSGEEICVAISDQGPGLSAEQERRIFEPFFTTKAKGTGLGMAIVQRIIHSHGGTIVASSPRGAQIEIRLPRGAT